MTQAEFNKHYKDYISNFTEKYQHLDLDFNTIMFMKGVSKEEFQTKIKHVFDKVREIDGNDDYDTWYPDNN